jgi:membrane protein implicated in regulation of membrane protease activity
MRAIKQMKNKKYTAYALITTILEEAALAAIVLCLLPRLEIHVPLWGLILMMVALGAYSYITYKLGKRALDKKPMVSPDIANKCVTTTPLTPRGYVKVDGELWKASSTGSNIDKDTEVVIAKIKGLTLLVTPLDRSNHEADKADVPSS